MRWACSGLRCPDGAPDCGRTPPGFAPALSDVPPEDPLDTVTFLQDSVPPEESFAAAFKPLVIRLLAGSDRCKLAEFQISGSRIDVFFGLNRPFSGSKWPP